jgi:hypothetical protein
MTITINGTTGIAGVDGSASTPSYQGADTNTGIFYPAADTIAFAEGGAEVARFNSSGQLGIGTTAPTIALDVRTTDAAAGRFSRSGTSGQITSIVFEDGSGTLGSANTTRIASSEGYLAFSTGGTSGSTTGGTERMRILSNGYVYINNSTSTASQDGHISIAATVAGQQCIDSWNSATSGTRFHAKFRDSAGATVRGSITSDGANTAYVTSSDYRLKENISLLTNALSIVVQLKPSTWTWKENQEAGQGFIAHELAEIVPQAVTGEKDAVDANGNPQYQGVDTSFLVATLTAAIQELKAELDTVKAQNAAFEARLAALEAK